ncbi:hypothetical protein, partial [Streptomyces sp. H27-D2]|uniref:hypothetical protein n=1 Tax=Streptomyces sp. H27-D2 TaxID=3046304 RepID=UPI003FA718F7
MASTLRAVAAIGPFFALRTDDPQDGRGPADEGYLPVAELYRRRPAADSDGGFGNGDGGGDQAPPALSARVAAVAGRLGASETRIAASLVFQGLASRLWSVALGSAALAGRVPDLAPDRLWWHPERGSPDDLWLPGPRALPAAGDLAGQLRAVVLGTHLEPLHRATGTVCGISGRLLWGNAGSALAGVA